MVTKNYGKKRVGGSKSVSKKRRYVLSGKGAYKKKSYRRSYTPRQSKQGIGESIGGALGSTLGGLAESGLKMLLTGFGDYAPLPMQMIPKQNSIMRDITENGPPMIRNQSDGSVVISFKEFIGDITTSSVVGAFKRDDFQINPGLQSTFPWLSQIAPNFQEYKWNGLLFEYRSTCGDAVSSTNNSVGTTILATDYDATDNVAVTFGNKQLMMNHHFSSSCKMSDSMLHPIECAEGMTPKGIFHVRTGLEPPNADLRLTDIGSFSIATVGAQAAGINVGELHVTYEIVFMKPQPLSQIGADVLVNKIFNNAGVTTAAYFGGVSSIALRPFSTLNITYTTNQLRFPPLLQTGSFLVMISWNGANTAAVNPPSVALTNCTIPLLFVNGTNGSIQAPVPSASASQCVLIFVVNINAANAFIQLSGGTLPTSAQVDVIVSEFSQFIQN